jgi:glycosyltransferase involved in cell wall biosynthesis
VERVLDALFADQGRGGTPSFEVLVVDNRPNEAIRRIVERFPARYLEETRPGSYAARNRGIAEARGEILAFTDADCIPPPGWLGTVQRTFADPSRLAAVGPSYAVNRSPVARWVQSVDDDRAARLGREPAIAFCDTRNLALRRSVVDGGFDADFRWAGDLELGLRLAQAGVPIAWEPALAVGHENPDSLLTSARRGIRRGRGLAALERKHGAMRISGSRELRVLGRDLKPHVLRSLRAWPLRPVGVVGAGAAVGVGIGALSLVRALRIDPRHGVGPYRLVDRGAILLGRLLA